MNKSSRNREPEPTLSMTTLHYISHHEEEEELVFTRLLRCSKRTLVERLLSQGTDGPPYPASLDPARALLPSGACSRHPQAELKEDNRAHSECSFLFLFTIQGQVCCQTQDIIHFRIMKCIRQQYHRQY